MTAMTMSMNTTALGGPWNHLHKTPPALSCEKSSLDNKERDPTPPASPKDVGPRANPFGPAGAEADSDVSIAEQVALTMGIPETVIQLAKDFNLLEHGTNFADASQLFAAAEELLSNPRKQADIAKKLYEHELKQKETASKEAVENKVVEAHCAAAKGSEGHSAEMLKEKVKRLALENHKLRQRKMCRECKKVDLASSGVTFLPCGHFITCETCSEKFDNCPACGKSIMGTVRTFLS